MTRSHDRPFLRGPRHPRCQARRSKAPRLADDAQAWHQQQTGPRCGVVYIAINIAMWKRLYQHLQYQGTPTKDEDDAGLRTRSLVFFFSSLSCTLGLPLVYKSEGLAPCQGMNFQDPEAPRLWGLRGILFFQPIGVTSTPLHFHQRHGSSSLSRPFATPTTDPSASNTSSSPLDVGTFSPNKYTSSCPLCTPSELKRPIVEIY
jgi:hypothetical protein